MLFFTEENLEIENNFFLENLQKALTVVDKEMGLDMRQEFYLGLIQSEVEHRKDAN